METLKKLVEQALKSDSDILLKQFGTIAVENGLQINFWQTNDRGIGIGFSYLNSTGIRDVSLSDRIFNHPFMQAACDGLCLNDEVWHMKNLVELKTEREKLDYVQEHIIKEV